MDVQRLFKDGMDRDLGPLLVMPSGTVLNLGAGNKVLPGAVPLDYERGWDADKDPIPYQNGSVAGVHAYHFLEHLEDPVRVLQEVQRVLMVGGVLNICVPYYSSAMAHHDLDHKKFFTEDTWRNLMDNPYYNKFGHRWQMRVTFNVIIGVVERNLALLTQMVKESDDG